jgi:Sel1 repeat
LELPVDPVMAMDNRVYERAQIEKYFEGKTSAQIKSPMTSEKMGKTLRPAIQHRNTIETLIETGAIRGEMAQTWKKGVQNMEQRAKLVEKASGGDVDAMLEVAKNFHEGSNGFAEDNEAALEWYEKASSKGSIIAMAELGDMLVVGDGVPQDEPHGLVQLGVAAGKGSDLAAFALGTYYADGDHGLPVDKDKAIGFLQDALSDKCVHSCMNAEAKLNAKNKLEKLLYGLDDDDDDDDDEYDDDMLVFESEERNDFLDDGDY